MWGGRNVTRQVRGSVPWRAALVGGVLGLAIAAVSFAPAQWLAAVLRSVTHEQLVLLETRGTVWNGSGRLVLTGGAGSQDVTALPGRIDWQLRPAALGMKAQVHADCCTSVPVSAVVTARWGGVRVSVLDGASQWPAALLTGLGTPWNTVQAQGNLQLVTTGLALDWAEGQAFLAGTAELTASNMSSRLSTLKPMGSYRILLTGGAATGFVLTTLEGSMQLSGSGRWVGSRLRFEGVASAAPEHEAALANLLNIIGRRSGARSIISLG